MRTAINSYFNLQFFSFDQLRSAGQKKPPVIEKANEVVKKDVFLLPKGQDSIYMDEDAIVATGPILFFEWTINIKYYTKAVMG